MSRKLLTVAALAALVLPLTTANAQMGFGVAAGLSTPTGNFGKGVDAGYHATGIVTLSAPLAPVGFRGEVSFNQFAAKSPSTAKFNTLSGTANATFSAPGMMGVYVIGGLGMYHNSCSSCGTTNTSNKFGFNGGAGFKFGLSGFSAFLEARYHTFSNDNPPGGSTSYIPISFGILF